jgi:AraC-like DNA-binding protein
MLLKRMYTSHYPASEFSLTNRHIQKFIRLVNSNFQHNRSVDFYAQQLNITPGHLNDVVKQHLGINAKQHILNRTMLEAKRLLSYTQLSVDEIATHLNYENTSYFVRAFRNSTNQTPLLFRKNEIHEK